MHRRWYDIDPTISLAVSILRNASDDVRVKCAEFMISYAKERNVTLKSSSLNNAFNYIMRRWYDKDKTVSEAFEYFECASFDIQKEIALEIIHFLQASETV